MNVQEKRRQQEEAHALVFFAFLSAVALAGSVYGLLMLLGIVV